MAWVEILPSCCGPKNLQQAHTAARQTSKVARLQSTLGHSQGDYLAVTLAEDDVSCKPVVLNLFSPRTISPNSISIRGLK